MTETTDTLKKRIMVVEDDPFISDIYHVKLSDSGYDVVMVDNGLEAIKKLEEGEKPDLMLLDIVMPYMDGREVLKKMSETEGWKSIPVILLTNISEKQQVEEAFQYGARDYLIKSHFTPSEVVDKVADFFVKNGT